MIVHYMYPSFPAPLHPTPNSIGLTQPSCSYSLFLIKLLLLKKLVQLKFTWTNLQKIICAYSVPMKMKWKIQGISCCTYEFIKINGYVR